MCGQIRNIAWISSSLGKIQSPGSPAVGRDFQLRLEEILTPFLRMIWDFGSDRLAHTEEVTVLLTAGRARERCP